jgi:hypothetical protein
MLTVYWCSSGLGQNMEQQQPRLQYLLRAVSFGVGSLCLALAPFQHRRVQLPDFEKINTLESTECWEIRSHSCPCSTSAHSFDISNDWRFKRNCVGGTVHSSHSNGYFCKLLVSLLTLQFRTITATATTTTGYWIQSSLKIVLYFLIQGLAFFLIIFCKMKGIRSSGVQFIFWALLAFCETFAFRTALINVSKITIQWRL